jgi:DtxR family Mn-dependent transcriptional regulator
VAKRGARLTRSKEDYVKALYTLGEIADRVATSQIAAHLGVSAPSVTHMLGRLAAEGLVSHASRSGARLTEKGRKVALELVRRHRILETFLVRVLGLDWAQVHQDAEVLEHHISDRVLEAIDRLIGHPDEDPHGHLIPDSHGRVRARVLRPLASLPRGARATVREIRDEDERRMTRWKQVGLVPGAELRICEVRSLEDVFEIEIAGRTLVTGSEGLEGILVELERNRRPTAAEREKGT